MYLKIKPDSVVTCSNLAVQDTDEIDGMQHPFDVNFCHFKDKTKWQWYNSTEITGVEILIHVWTTSYHPAEMWFFWMAREPCCVSCFGTIYSALPPQLPGNLLFLCSDALKHPWHHDSAQHIPAEAHLSFWASCLSCSADRKAWMPSPCLIKLPM